MAWHFEPLLWTARHYDDPSGWERRVQYNLIATVQNIGGGRAVISGLMGEMSKEAHQELETALRGLGFNELQAWRRRRLVTWK